MFGAWPAVQPPQVCKCPLAADTVGAGTVSTASILTAQIYICQEMAFTI